MATADIEAMRAHIGGYYSTCWARTDDPTDYTVYTVELDGATTPRYPWPF